MKKTMGRLKKCHIGQDRQRRNLYRHYERNERDQGARKKNCTNTLDKGRETYEKNAPLNMQRIVTFSFSISVRFGSTLGVMRKYWPECLCGAGGDPSPVRGGGLVEFSTMRRNTSLSFLSSSPWLISSTQRKGLLQRDGEKKRDGGCRECDDVRSFDVVKPMKDGGDIYRGQGVRSRVEIREGAKWNPHPLSPQTQILLFSFLLPP